MANQRRTAGAGLWFVTAEGTGTFRSLAADPHINLSYYYGSDARMDLGVRPGDDLTRSAEDSAESVVLYELMKGWITGTEPELGKMHTLKP